MKKCCLTLLLVALVSVSFAEQKITITYPHKDVNTDNVFTQETLENRSIIFFPGSRAQAFLVN